MRHSDIGLKRLRTQRLAGPPLSRAIDVVAWLGAVQAQELPVAKWSLAQRARGVTNATVERDLAAGRILRTHVLRPTWHFVLPQDIRWMVELTAPRINAKMAYYDRQLELTDAVYRRCNRLIGRALSDGRHRTRRELAAVLQSGGVAVHPQRLGHIMMRAELDLVVCSGAPAGKQQTYALVEQRAPRSRSLARDEAIAELAQRYFTSHGPATLKDYMWWSSLTAADVRRSVEIAGSKLKRETVEGRTYWSSGAIRGAREASPRALLLQGYDEFIVGYTESKDALNLAGLTGAARLGQLSFLHAVAIQGQVVGHWRRAPGDAATLELQLARSLARAERRALDAEVKRYGVFLGSGAAWRDGALEVTE
jgi:winged helix DNA-binding protein